MITQATFSVLHPRGARPDTQHVMLGSFRGFVIVILLISTRVCSRACTPYPRTHTHAFLLQPDGL